MDFMNLVAKLTLDDSDYQSKVGGLASGLGKAAKVGGAAIAAASGAVVAFGKSSVDAGMDFDKAMAQVAATSGKSVDEIGELRDFALEMGSSTAFSATEAAEALNYMALAGYDANTSMEMLPTVLNLAAAGGMDLASASDMVTDAQTALGLSLDETRTMVDEMAKTSSTTNTSVSQLGAAFLTIGGNAKTLKGGTAELSQVLGILADNGIKGSEAGTHLRNILLNLTPKTDEAAAAWESLGVKAYDANGNLRSMDEIFGDLSQSLDGMTSEERTNKLSAMFNKTDLAAVNALLDTESDRWDEVAGAIDGATGSAEAMANTQLDNLSGDVTLFKSALEGAQIAMSDQLTPTLRDFVQLGTEGLSDVTKAFREDGIEGAMTAVGTWLSNALAQITETLPKVVEAGAKLLTSLIDGITQNIPQIMKAAVQIILSLVQAIVQNLPKIIEAGIQAILEFRKGLAEALPDLIPTIVDAVLTIVETLIDNIDMLVDSGIQIILALAEGLIKALPKIIEKVPVIIEKLVKAFVDSIPKIAEAGVKLLTGLIKNLPNIISGILQALPSLISGIVRGILSTVGTIAAAGVQLFVSLVSQLPKIISSIVNKIPEIIKAIVGGFKDGFSDIVSVGKELLEGLGKGIVNGVKGVVEKAKNAAKSILNAVKGFFGVASPSKEFAEIGGYLMEGMATGINNNLSMVSDALGNLQTAVDANIPEMSFNAEGNAGAVRVIDGMTFNIYGAANQNVRELADAVADRFQTLVEMRSAVWA